MKKVCPVRRRADVRPPQAEGLPHLLSGPEVAGHDQFGCVPWIHRLDVRAFVEPVCPARYRSADDDPSSSSQFDLYIRAAARRCGFARLLATVSVGMNERGTLLATTSHGRLLFSDLVLRRLQRAPESYSFARHPTVPPGRRRLTRPARLQIWPASGPRRRTRTGC